MDKLEQLELAKKYLENRSISTEKSKSQFYKGLLSVNQASEVSFVLEMVSNGSFEDFYNVVKQLDESLEDYDFPKFPKSEVPNIEDEYNFWPIFYKGWIVFWTIAEKIVVVFWLAYAAFQIVKWLKNYG